MIAFVPIVERVVRQFGCSQTILPKPNSEDALHKTNLKGRHGADGPTDCHRSTPNGFFYGMPERGGLRRDLLLRVVGEDT